jgi:Ni/Fe-hydrogenase 1 B-type cytochrome subunit
MTVYRRVAVWQLPVRLWHWAHFGSLVTLSVTGYYIGNPFVSPSVGYAFGGHGVPIMAWMRLVHFASAAVLTLMVFWRLYWFIAGNEYSNWRAWVPLSSRRELLAWLRDLKEQALYYLFLRRDPPEMITPKPLASLSYLAALAMLVGQVLTGWALYGEFGPNHIIRRLFGWMFSILGHQYLRYAHHMLMWLIIAFFIVHLYMAIRDDVLGSHGTMTAMISGYKYEPHGEASD